MICIWRRTAKHQPMITGTRKASLCDCRHKENSGDQYKKVQMKGKNKLELLKALGSRKCWRRFRGSEFSVNFHVLHLTLHCQQASECRKSLLKNSTIETFQPINEGEINLWPFDLGAWVVNHSMSWFRAGLECDYMMAGLFWHSLIQLKCSCCILRRDPDSPPVTAQRLALK